MNMLSILHDLVEHWAGVNRKPAPQASIQYLTVHTPAGERKLAIPSTKKSGPKRANARAGKRRSSSDDHQY